MSPSYRRSVLGVHWKDWCWSCNINNLSPWCKELTHCKRPWCWEGLGAGGEGDNRGWDGWKASPTQWTWVWVNSRSWWWTGRPGMLRFMGSPRVGHNWLIELNPDKFRYRTHLHSYSISSYPLKNWSVITCFDIIFQLSLEMDLQHQFKFSKW